jgi:hypothetical protein
MSPINQPIENMDPRRYARVAKRAAVLAKELADKAGKEVSVRTRYLVESSEENIAIERAKELGVMRRSILMNADDVVEFLDWLENTFPLRLEFKDKHTLAEEFVEQRSWKRWREYREDHQ